MENTSARYKCATGLIPGTPWTRLTRTKDRITLHFYMPVFQTCMYRKNKKMFIQPDDPQYKPLQIQLQKYKYSRTLQYVNW